MSKEDAIEVEASSGREFERMREREHAAEILSERSESKDLC
jgi:hypothetical protein